MLTSALVLGLLGALQAIHALPSFEVPFSLVNPKDTPTAWACDVGAWVRAPDLYPNFRTQADARLAMNGTDCGDVVKWEVGLRLFERSIFRFRAEGVEIPDKPRFNHSREFTPFNNSIFQVERNHIIFPREDSDPVFVAQTQEYTKKVNDPKLWVVKGVERKVFDVKKLLSEVHGSESMPETSVKSFEVHMPNTNFPPMTASWHHQWFHRDSNKEMTNVETMFEYYFFLTLRNGTILDRPAGRTAFLPISPPPPASSVDQVLTVDLTNERSYNRGNPAHRLEMMMGSEPAGRGEPACNNGSVALFTVHVQLPQAGHFEQGQTVWLNTTVTRHGNGTEYPRSIKLFHMPCNTLTWASQFATTAEQKLAAEACQEAVGFFGEEGGLLQTKPFNYTSYREEERASSHRISGRSYHTSRFPHLDGIRLDPDLEEQSVLVNLTIPEYAIPTFNATFHSFSSRIGIKLYTKFGCEEQEIQIKEAVPEDDSDAHWQEHMQPHSSRFIRASSRPPHSGNMSTIIVRERFDPAMRSATLPVDYRLPEAQAPMLVGVSEVAGEFPLVLTEQLEESGESDLRVSRYLIWERLSPGGVLIRAGRQSGATQFVGNVWQMKEVRQRLREMDEADQKETALSSGSGFIVQI